MLAAIYYGYLYRILDGTHRYMMAALVGLMSGVAIAVYWGAPLTGFGWSGWLFWTLLIVFLIRVEHPPVVQQESLTPTRRALGYVAIAIFVLCFSFRPLTVL